MTTALTRDIVAAQMATIETAGGVRLHVHDHGTGALAIVLLHGWSLSHRAFAPQLEDLAGAYRVVSPDLRGHGRSSAPATGYALEDFAADVRAIFDALDLSGAVLVGWSWGAEIAIAALPAIRDRVSALALLSATPRFTSTSDWTHGLEEARVRALRARLARAPDATRRGFFDAMFAPGEFDDASRDRLAEDQLADAPAVHAARATLDTLATADVRGCIPALRDVPVLLVHGDRDGICLPGASAWLHGELPRSRREVVHGAGHAPQLSRAKDVTELLATFAESVR